MKPGLVVVIGGPTASGKTDLAIRLASILHTEIISADSRQVYKELNIGVARPSASELKSIKHHFVADRSIESVFNSGVFAREGGTVLEKLIAEKGVALLCGGTGLYINALLYGLDELPAQPSGNRLAIADIYHRDGGLPALQKWLLEVSPNAENMIDLNNPARVQRALELVLDSNKPLEEIWSKKPKNSNYKILGYYLEPARDNLYKNINQRTLSMFERGLVDEVKSLMPHRGLNALNSVGYKEVFEYIDGILSKEACISLVQQHSRNYAKRQLTWFRNSTDFKPIHPDLAMDLIFDDLNKHGYTVHQ